MRLTKGKSARIILADGTTIEGTVTRSWRFRVVKLVDAVTLTRDGNVKLDGYLLVPARSILFVQVGA